MVGYHNNDAVFMITERKTIEKVDNRKKRDFVHLSLEGKVHGDEKRP